MEFDHVGVHCQFEACNQKDFLPFRCDLCNKMLCLQHRSVLAHSCDAQGSRDMISNDCPLCGKSFKFLRSEDPNAAWQTHFTSECSQSGGGSSEVRLKCCSATCRNILGPSNTYQCKICHQKVCLTHRNPEDHQCKDGRSTALEKRLAAIAPPSTNNNKSTTSQIGDIKKKIKKSAVEDPSNTLKGSAQRRMMRQSETSPAVALPSNTASPAFECPFCAIAMIDSDALQEHVNSKHLSDVPEASSVIPSASDETCPQCQQRFNSVTDLIAHVERSHQQSSSSSIGDNCIVH